MSKIYLSFIGFSIAIVFYAYAENKPNNNKKLVELFLDKSYQKGVDYKHLQEYDASNMLLNLISSKAVIKKNNTAKDTITQDSLLRAKPSYNNQSASIRNESGQAKKRIKQQQYALQIPNKRWLFMSIFILLFLMSSLVLGLQTRKIRKQKKMLENKNTTINELQKEMHHRLNNNFSYLNNRFINEVIEKMDSGTLNMQDLLDLRSRVVSIAEVHLLLYQSSDVTKLNIKTYIDELIKNIISIYHIPRISIQNGISEDLTIDAERSFVLALIINELVINAIKYAFDKQTNQIIKINANVIKNQYVFTVSDNGKGLPVSYDIQQSTNGLKLVYLLLMQLDGKANYENKSGLHFTITFPK